jgi:L-lactate utilization protein LutC
MDQAGIIRELAMTLEEFCDALRHAHPSREMCKEAADVIERLEEENSQLKVILIRDYELYKTEVEAMTAQLKQLMGRWNG